MTKTTDPTVLLLGFLPFDGHAVNPSQQLVEAYATTPNAIPGLRCVGEALPVVLSKALPMASAAIARHRPHAVVAMGQSPSPAIRIERCAVNRASFSIPDEEGHQPIDQPIVAGGPQAYPSTLPTRQLWDAMLEQGIPAVPSDSAGTYLCNALMYHLLHTAAQSGDFIAGFLHVPLLPEQACDVLTKTRQTQDAAASPAPPSIHPSMTLAMMQRGLQIALEVIRVYLSEPAISRSLLHG